MLKPLKSYQSRNDIYTDLDLSENEMSALYDIFEIYGAFQYDEVKRHCFLKKPDISEAEKDKGFRMHSTREEEQHRGIDFVIWKSDKRKLY